MKAVRKAKKGKGEKAQKHVRGNQRRRVFESKFSGQKESTVTRPASPPKKFGARVTMDTRYPITLFRKYPEKFQEEEKMKRMPHRLLAAVLCAALLFSTAVTASAKGFADISKGSTYMDAVNYVSDNGIMDGTTPTKFAFSSTLTRAMIVAILYRKAGSPYSDWTAEQIKNRVKKYTDVSPTSYYAVAIAWAEDMTITNGTSTTTFSPNRDVTREQAMTFLYRYALKTGLPMGKMENITGKSDYSAVSTYAQQAMS